jgi:hypothetical protein
MQKTAALCFCTPDLCKKNRCALFLHSGFMQKKPLRSVFALRIYAKNRCALFLHSEYMQKTAALYFCTPDL